MFVLSQVEKLLFTGYGFLLLFSVLLFTSYNGETGLLAERRDRILGSVTSPLRNVVTLLETPS
jgi:hypothetical protein